MSLHASEFRRRPYGPRRRPSPRRPAAKPGSVAERSPGAQGAQSHSLRKYYEVVAMDHLVRLAVREIRGATPRYLTQRRGRIANESFGERTTVVADDLDGVFGGERPFDITHPSRKQGPALVHQRALRTGVDGDATRSAARERDPQFAARQPL